MFKGYVDRKQRSRLKSKNLRFQVIAKQKQFIEEIEFCLNKNN